MHEPPFPFLGAAPRVVGEELRREIKFVVDESDGPRLVHWLRLNHAGFRRHHPERTVNNIYFDTVGLAAYAENLSGVSSRSKVRFRWYGESRTPAPGTLEIKRKRNQFGWKLRYPIEHSPYRPGAEWGEIRSGLRDQLPAAGRIWLQLASIPVLVNRYRRQYLISADGRVRATVDTKNAAWNQFSVRRPDFGARGGRSRMVIVELKFDAGCREEVSRLLRGMPVRVSRWSKYVSGVASSGLA